MALLLLSGAGYMTAIAASNTLIQTLVQENLRGRVMAFYTMAFLGTMPLGSLASGIIAERLDAPMTIALGGVACVVTGAWFMSRLAVTPRGRSPDLHRARYSDALTPLSPASDALPGVLEQDPARYWGYNSFRPHQREAMDAVLDGARFAASCSRPAAASRSASRLRRCCAMAWRSSSRR